MARLRLGARPTIILFTKTKLAKKAPACRIWTKRQWGDVLETKNMVPKTIARYCRVQNKGATIQGFSPPGTDHVQCPAHSAAVNFQS